MLFLVQLVDRVSQVMKPGEIVAGHASRSYAFHQQIELVSRVIFLI